MTQKEYPGLSTQEEIKVKCLSFFGRLPEYSPTDESKWCEQIALGVKQKAISLLEEKDKEIIEFPEWIEARYTMVTSERLKKSAWVNHYEHIIRIHGSDEHFTQLIEKFGQTTSEIYAIFKQSKTHINGKS